MNPTNYHLFKTVRIGMLLLAMMVWDADHESIAFRVAPDVVQMGAWYDGARVHVQAEIPKDCQAVFELSGKPFQAGLLRKEKHWGMWRNGKKIIETGAPSLYMVMSTDGKLLTDGSGAATWGSPALAERIRFDGDMRNVTARELFEEFLQMQQGRGLYGIFPGHAVMEGSPDTVKMAKGVFDLPSRLAEGTYRITLFAVRKGHVIFKRTQALKVERVGFPSAVYDLAHRHPLVYGVLAAGIAIMSGFLVGLIFHLLARSK